MNFTVYDPTTGAVAYTGSCPDEDFVLQARPGLELIEGDYPGSKFYFDGQAMVAFPPQPSAQHTWHWPSKAWRLDATMADGQARTARLALLRDSDWTQLPDVPPETSALWRPYRQALRDITKQPGYPTSITWPEPPTS